MTRNRQLVTVLSALLLVGAAGVLSACYTLEGVGKDLGAAGTAVSTTITGEPGPAKPSKPQ
jgi:predicted small secreted protein